MGSAFGTELGDSIISVLLISVSFFDLWAHVGPYSRAPAELAQWSERCVKFDSEQFRLFRGPMIRFADNGRLSTLAHIEKQSREQVEAHVQEAEIADNFTEIRPGLVPPSGRRESGMRSISICIFVT
jgi:hypothetical protein